MGAALERRPNPDTDRRTRTIVCIDDEPAVLSALQRSLWQEPYEVRTTSDPSRVLEWVTGEVIDLVIADERMPLVPGTKLLEEIRDRSPDTTRMILTAYADGELVLKGVNEAIQWLITKPWSEASLRRTIRQLLEERERDEWRRRVFRADSMHESLADTELRLPVECRRRRPAEILDAVGSVLERASRTHGAVCFFLMDLGELLGSVSSFLCSLIAVARESGLRVRVVDPSGLAYSLVRALHRSPPFEGVEVAICESGGNP